MGTKNNPGKYDCYANADPDEPMFILLARDASAPDLVKAWALQRKVHILKGEKPDEDMDMVNEAMQCVKEMEKWRKENRPQTPPAGGLIVPE